jgi:hypothetical protein
VPVDGASEGVADALKMAGGIGQKAEYLMLSSVCVHRFMTQV